MSASRELLEARARQYAERHALGIEAQLGYGMHGIVFSTNCKSAIKVFERQNAYVRERDVYLRLQELNLFQLNGFAVPRLVRYDDALQVVEMTIVNPPFVLDFAGAYLDIPPDYSDEVLADWRTEKLEQFGEKWSEVESLIDAFAAMGIYLADVRPGNVSFPV
jgi:hypothetical protein